MYSDASSAPEGQKGPAEYHSPLDSGSRPTCTFGWRLGAYELGGLLEGQWVPRFGERDLCGLRWRIGHYRRKWKLEDPSSTSQGRVIGRTYPKWQCGDYKHCAGKFQLADTLTTAMPFTRITELLDHWDSEFGEGVDGAEASSSSSGTTTRSSANVAARVLAAMILLTSAAPSESTDVAVTTGEVDFRPIGIDRAYATTTALA